MFQEAFVISPRLSITDIPQASKADSGIILTVINGGEFFRSGTDTPAESASGCRIQVSYSKHTAGFIHTSNLSESIRLISFFLPRTHEITFPPLAQCHMN